jgi:flagellar export protein FliJ
MGFKFPLEAVLRLRASVESQEQTRLEIAARALYAAREHCDALEKQRLAEEASFHESLVSGIESPDLYFHISARSGMEVAQLQAERALLEAHKRWNDQRARFLLARRQREVIDSIRERQLADFAIDQDRRTQQEIDDLFAARRVQIEG